MGNQKRVGDLEIDQDLEFQERDWAAERIGWTAMLLVLLVALLGVFGAGPLSHTTAGEREGQFWLEYQRFAHYDAPTLPLVVHVDTNLAQEGQVQLWFERDYLQSFQVEGVLPEPKGVEIGIDRYIYVFEVGETGPPTQVTFILEPEQIGRVSGRIGIQDTPGLEISHFFYP